MRKLVFFLLFTNALCCRGQNIEPVTLIRQALSNENSRNGILSISKPGLADRVNNIDLEQLKQFKSIDIVEINDTLAIVNLEVSGNRNGLDSILIDVNYYLFLQKKDKWYVEDIKTSNVVYMYNSMMIDTLNAKCNLNSMQQWAKENAFLGLYSDRQLENYFNNNKEDFEQLYLKAKNVAKEKGIKYAAIETVDSVDTNNLLYKHHFIYSSILRENCECIAFTISDYYNRRVGFIKISDSSKLHDFGYKRFVFPINLKNGWYVFRGKI